MSCNRKNTTGAVLFTEIVCSEISLTNRMSLKICVVGPKGNCKTTIANFLANQSERLSPDKYDPTAGDICCKRRMMNSLIIASFRC